MIDLRAIRLFVFDFDGTLVQSNAIKRNTFYEITAGMPSAHAKLEGLFETKPHLDRYGICFELSKIIEGLDAAALAREYTMRCEDQILAAPEVSGALETLKTLRRKGRITVINSATPEIPLRQLVSRMSIGPLIHATYGEPVSKVDNLRKAMTLANCAAFETVVVGDGERDRRSADQMNCAFIAVASDDNAFSASPKNMVRRLDELIAWL